MKTTIQKLTVPSGCRILIVSDVHGCDTFLRRLLDMAKFGPKDQLFIDGDLVERGPESLRTIRYVMELCQGGNVHVLMGNNDAYKLETLLSQEPSSDVDFLRWIEHYHKSKRRNLYQDMLDEIGLMVPKLAEVPKVKGRLREHFAPELAFLQQCPTIIDTQTLVFVHGGLPSLDYEKLKKGDAYEFMKNDAFWKQGYSFERYVVVGHWPVTLYSSRIKQYNPIIDKKHRIISIDGGCGIKEDGQLNLLMLPDIDSEDFIYMSYDAFPEATAQDSQQASVDSINIRWIDRQVTVLEQGEAFAAVRHHASGRILDVPVSCLYEWDGETCCDDYSDYELEILPGDRVKIVADTPRGYIVKKDGVVGWYRGRIV